VLTAHTEADLEAAFAIMVQQGADALLVIAGAASALMRNIANRYTIRPLSSG
jgi:hypothetical protein